jgi:hypothetical protein
MPKTRYIALFLSIVLLITSCDIDTFDRRISSHIDHVEHSMDSLDQGVTSQIDSITQTMEALENLELPDPLEGWEMPKFPEPAERTSPKAGRLHFTYQFDGSVPGQYQDIVSEAGDFWADYISTAQTIALNVSAETAEESWLAKAKPTQIASNGLPAQGIVILNLVYAQKFADGRDYFRAVVIHEIGHVLGIGTLWQPLGLVDVASATYTANSHAGRFYGQPIPLEKGVLSHWDEETFKEELMTPLANQHMDLMDTTLASLRDIGWQVDRLENKQVS